MINKAGRTKHRHRTHSSVTEAYVKQEFRLILNGNDALNGWIFRNEFLIESRSIFEKLRKVPNVEITTSYSATELTCNLRGLITIFGITFLLTENSSISFRTLSIDLTKLNSLFAKMSECGPIKTIASNRFACAL